MKKLILTTALVSVMAGAAQAATNYGDERIDVRYRSL